MSQPRPEHPRPQFVRKNWVNLNGTWQFELDQSLSGVARKLYEQKALAETITVPFCPESRLSGIAHTDFIRGCWYCRTFDVSPAWQSGRILLHFDAVNYESIVYINGREVARHKGGYAPFTVDIRDFVQPGENVVTLFAASDVRSGRQPSGKQSDRFGSYGCMYTRTTGIWQTVWLEIVPETYLQKIFLTPDPENNCLHVRARLNRPDSRPITVTATFEGRAMGRASALPCGQNAYLTVPLQETHLWAPGEPNLYALEISCGEDQVRSYAGLRSIALKDGRFLINGQPVFQKLVLDQGFYPDGVITAPDDDALKKDILRGMAVGFNGARMHQKIFEPRYLYWADRLGYLVWGEHASWGLNLDDAAGFLAFLPEWSDAVERDYSAPSVIGWCPLNETSFNASPEVIAEIARATKKLDATRPVIDSSGWLHTDETDIFDYHDYEADPAKLRTNLEIYTAVKPGEPFPACRMDFFKNHHIPEVISRGQPIFLSEFGGVGWNMDAENRDAWGYGTQPHTKEEFLARYRALEEVARTVPGLIGYCYTQLTDVEQETNGLYTFARQKKEDT